MFQLNVTAYRQRYPQAKGATPVPHFSLAAPAAPPAVIYKSIDCLIYQCSEGDVPETPLFDLLERLLNSAAKETAITSPDYQTGGWGE